MNDFVIFTLLVLAARQLRSAEIRCEKKENYNWHIVGSAKACFMNSATTINSTGLTITPRDETIGGLHLQSNQKVRFLPEKVSETFPNFLAYYAYGCSLTEVSKIHFENLVKLRVLQLSGNQIEKIPSNTFEDLKSLEYLDLSKKHFPVLLSFNFGRL